MTVVIQIGRRVPKTMRSRFMSKIKNILGFQEHIWIMLGMSFKTAQKKWKNKTLKSDGVIDIFDITRKVENEDRFYKLEWMVIKIKGDKKGEEDEYIEANNMYKDLKGILKNYKNIESNDKLKEVFRSKFLSEKKLKEAYSKGYGSEKDKNIANILLEMGIITHIEWIKDYDARVVQPDF